MSSKTILIAIPNIGTVSTNFMAQMLGLNYRGYNINYQFLKGNLLYLSRDKLVLSAIKNKCDYIFFLDTDQQIPNDIVIKMAKYLDEGEDIVTALVFTKEKPYHPCIYSESKILDNGQISLTRYDMSKIENKPFYVENCGSGCVMIKVDVFKNIPQPWFHPYIYSGEDVTFFHVATHNYGYKILCDPTLDVGHWGIENINRTTKSLYDEEVIKMKRGDVL